MNIEIQNLPFIPFAALAGVVEHYGEVAITVRMDDGTESHGILMPDDNPDILNTHALLLRNPDDVYAPTRSVPTDSIHSIIIE